MSTLVSASQSNAIREAAINAALIPADASSTWVESRAECKEAELKQAFEGVAILQAANEHQEALAIALALRESIEKPENSAALVTPDRDLARRVSAELERFGIEIDDSAGQSLANTALTRFVKNMIRSTGYDADPVAMAAFVKDALLFNGEERQACELLELAVLRFAAQKPVAGNWTDAVEAAREQMGLSRYAPHVLRNLEEKDWERLDSLAGRIDSALQSLCALSDRSEEIPAELFCESLLKTIIACTASCRRRKQRL